MANDTEQSRLLQLRHLGDIIAQLLRLELMGTITVTSYQNGRIRLYSSTDNDQALLRERAPGVVRQLKQFGLGHVTEIQLERAPPPPAIHRAGPGLGMMLNAGGKVHTNRKERRKKPSDEVGDDESKETITMQELLGLAAKRERLTAVVKSLLDERVSEHIVGTDYHADDGELVVLCETSAWATQLRFLQRALIPALAEKGMTVRSVAVRVIPPREQRPATPPTPATPMSEDTARAIEGMAEHIGDAGLAEALHRLAKHCDKKK